jgi:hypothetical protein
MSDADDVRLLYDSRYIGAWDLLGRDVTVTIEKIVGGVIEGEGGKKDRAPVVSFKGWTKPMVLNKTNLKTLISLYATASAKGLLGKRVTMYATTCKGARGGQVDCIRFRPTVPTSPGVPQSAVGKVPVDQEMRKRQVAEVAPDDGVATSAAREPGSDDT